MELGERDYKAAYPFVGPGKWLSEFDLNKLASGAAKCFERIGSDTIQRVNAEFARRRKQSKRAKLRWRNSRGSKRSLSLSSVELPSQTSSRCEARDGG
jgi:hypothetical protein